MQRDRHHLTLNQSIARDIRERYGMEVTPDQVSEARERNMQRYRQHLIDKGEIPPDNKLALLLRWHMDYSAGKF